MKGELLNPSFPIPVVAAYLKCEPCLAVCYGGCFVSKTNDEVRVTVTGAAASVFRWREAEAAAVGLFGRCSLGIVLDASGMNDDLRTSAKYEHTCVVSTEERLLVSQVNLTRVLSLIHQRRE